MKLKVFIYVLMFCFASQAQNLVQISSTITGSAVSCGDPVYYSVEVNNISPYNLDSIFVDLNLPTGVSYILNSSTNGVLETNTTNLSNPTFELPDIPSLSSFEFQVSYDASCMDVYTGLSNDITFYYNGDNGTGGLVSGSQQHTSVLYNVLFPDLSITNITNQNTTGDIGDVFQRCISIINGGNGPLSNFEIFHEHGNGINVSGNTLGTSSVVAGGTLYEFSATDFTSVGNGDGFLDPGEVLVICETIEIVSCQDAQSFYNYRWGCSGEYCQEQVDAGNITFSSEAPDLVITRQNSFSSAANGLGTNCYGNNANGDFPSSIIINNIGTGDATDVNIDIGQAWSNANGFMVSNYYSSLNTSSFTIEVNGGGEQPLVLSSTTASTARACLPPNPVGAVSFEIPLIQPGDTVVVRWNHYTCCPTYCENNTRRHLLHWRLKGSYSNICGDLYDIPLTNALPGLWGGIYYRNNQVLDNSPGTLLGTNSGNVTFMTQNSSFRIPRNNANRLFKYQLIVPDNCLNVDIGSFELRNHLGDLQPAPNSIVTSGDTIEFIYDSPRTGNQWTVSFDVDLDCNTCSVEGVKTIEFNTLYSPDTNCGCWMLMGCTTADIEVLCPPVCEGVNLVNSSVERINLGEPDTNNDGLPDALGTPHDMNLVRTDRVMYGDTIKVENTAFVHDPNIALWDHLVSEVLIEDAGNRMTYHYSDLEIHKSNGTVLSCFGEVFAPTITTAGTDRLWVFDLELNNSAPCLPNNFELEDGDSIFLSNYFSNTTNWGNNAILATPVISKMYATNVPYDISLTNNDKFGCNEITKEFTLIGYYWTNWGSNSYSLDNCDDLTISQNYYLSIGACCGNYAGGNLFPFEYRHWGSIDVLSVEPPVGYELVSARFNFRRTAGTLVTNGTPWYDITDSLTINGNALDFEVANFFGESGSGAPIIYGDDGWYGTIQVTLSPTCNVESGTNSVRYEWFFDQVGQLATSNTNPLSFTTQDPITYSPPIMNLQSNQVFTNTTTGIDNWTLTASNTSNVSNAANFWIGAPTINGVIADSLMDINTGIYYYPNVNGIFDLGVLAADSEREFRLYTTSTNCNIDSIRVYSGWNCNGVPNEVDDYECDPLTVLLTVNPLTPSLENFFVLNSQQDIDLCDTIEIDLVVRNFQLGYAYNLLSNITLPFGLDYVNGSSSFSYDGVTTPLADPIIIGVDEYQWDLSSTVPSTDGLVGIVDTSMNLYTISFQVSPICGFESGSRILGTSIGQSLCGSNHSADISFSDQIYIDDVTPPYSTSINLGIDFITPCGINNDMTVSVINDGAGSFQASDSLTIFVPDGLAYNPGSFLSIHNAALGNTTPSISNIAGFQLLTWPLMQGVVANDSMVFSISLNTTASDLDCAPVEFRGITNAMLTATCSGDNTSCDVSVVTGEVFKNVFVYKTDFNLTNASGTVHLSPNGDETISGVFDLFNQGADLGTNTPLSIDLYNDVDMNGSFSPADVLVNQESINPLILAGQTYSYNFNNILADDVCGLIALVSLDDNPCICNSIEINIPLNFTSTNYADTLCSLESVQISTPVNSPYNFAWENNPNLSNLTIAQPVFNAVNNGNSPTTAVLVREIQRSSCSFNDTSFITINPLPLATITGDIEVCQDAAQPQITFTGSNSTAPYTFTYTINGGAPQTVTSTGNTATVNVPTTTPGTFTYDLVSVEDASATACSQTQTGSAVVTVNPLPLATIAGDIEVCQDAAEPQITFTGSNSTAPYTFTYTINGGAPQTVTSTGNTATVNVPTTTPGTYTYDLVSVQDASATACSQTQTGSAVVTVNPLPLATIAGNTNVCQDAAEPQITFTGSNSTAPYTFTYTINGGAPQTVTSTGNIATVNVPTITPGTYTYDLVSVQDASATACSQTQTGSAVVTVNPLPQATIAGDIEVCQDAAEPQITFTGSNSTAPYTFTYTINGGAPQTVTSTGNTATVNVPTITPGTYTYDLVSVQDASATACSQTQTGSAVVTVNPLPQATIAGDIEVCQDAAEPQITFTGSNSTAPYTFTYTINGGAPQTVTSTGNTATVNVPTITPGTYTYDLVSVQDASATACSQVQTGSAVVTVNPLPLATIAGNTNVCQDAAEPQITFMGSNSTAPYTFTYTINGGAPQTVTSAGNTATVNVPTITPGTYTYDLVSVQDASATACSQVQTGSAVVTVNLLPLATIAGDIEVCQDAAEPQITFTGSNSTAPYTFTYTINGGAPQTVTSTGNTATVNVPTTTPGTYTYDLVSVQDASATACSQVQTGSAVVTVNPLPLATIAGDIEVCQDAVEPQITFTGSNSTAPYTFTYTINGGAPQTVTSTGSTATVNVPTTTPGTYTYDLVSVQDASATACSQTQTGSAVVTVNPLPLATIAGNTNVCQDAAEPQITFTGSNSTAPYTFTYTINGGAPQTVTSTGNTATVNVPTTTPGTYTYDLVSVQDASVTACSQVQTGSAVVTVNPLPLATIAGDIEVCQDAAEPQITFTGSNSTAPYTFTYTINGGAPQTVTSTGNTATVNVPTTTPGTYTYDLVSVQDASATACSQSQTGTATVVVNTLPEASIAGDIEVCLNSQEIPYVTFVGSNGIAPYTFTYSLNGQVSQTVVSNSVGTGTVAVPTNQAGSFEYELLSVEDSSVPGCTQIQTGIVTVVVHDLPTATIIGNDSICQNEEYPEIEFTGDLGSPSYTFGYSINSESQTVSSGGNNNAIITVPTENAGTFVYTLDYVEESYLGCTQNLSESVTIVVHPLPIPSFDPTPSTVILSQNTSQMQNSSSGAENYIWTFPDGSTSSLESPHYTFDIENVGQEFVILLEAISEYGCKDFTERIVVVEEDLIIYVPNTFTPDGDGRNDVFTPVITEGVDPTDYSFRIYNRWGELIFETTDTNSGWDGYYQGLIAKDGTYVWQMEFRKSTDSERMIKTGSVNLLR